MEFEVSYGVLEAALLFWKGESPRVLLAEQKGVCFRVSEKSHRRRSAIKVYGGISTDESCAVIDLLPNIHLPTCVCCAVKPLDHVPRIDVQSYVDKRPPASPDSHSGVNRGKRRLQSVMSREGKVAIRVPKQGQAQPGGG